MTYDRIVRTIIYSAHDFPANALQQLLGKYNWLDLLHLSVDHGKAHSTVIVVLGSVTR